MSVWDSLVGQQPVIDMLSRIAQGDSSQIAQSWLICGPPGSGRSNMARAFAAALESPDHRHRPGARDHHHLRANASHSTMAHHRH